MRSRRWSWEKLPVKRAERLMLPLLLAVTLPLASCRSGGATTRPPTEGLSTGPSASPSTLTFTLTAFRQRQSVQELPPPPGPPPPALTLTLAESVRLALERHPRIAAQRTTLAAAEDGKRAIEALRVPVAIVRAERSQARRA